jgi:K(+)-stimulated pyrophosphate-energized sodium pump
MMQGLSSFEQTALWSICVISLLSVVYAFYLRAKVLREPMGDKEMLKIWLAISDGAKAYLKQQLKRIVPIMGLLAIALFLSVYVIPPSKEALERFAAIQVSTSLSP